MELRWGNRKDGAIGIANVTNSEAAILRFMGYEHFQEEDVNDEDGELVEIWKPM